MNIAAQIKYVQAFSGLIAFIGGLFAITNLSYDQKEKAFAWFLLFVVGLLNTMWLISLSRKLDKKNKEEKEIEMLRATLFHMYNGTWGNLQKIVKLYKESEFKETRVFAKKVLDEIHLFAYKGECNFNYEEDTYMYIYPKIKEEEIKNILISIYKPKDNSYENSYGPEGRNWSGHYSHMENTIAKSNSNLKMLMMSICTMNETFGTNYRIYEIKEALIYYKNKLKEFNLLD